MMSLSLPHLVSTPAVYFFFSLIRPPPTSTLFPYTTLFRSGPLDRPSPIGAHWDPHEHPAVGTMQSHGPDRKSTRLNSSHRCISYAVFCLKKKKKTSNSRH